MMTNDAHDASDDLNRAHSRLSQGASLPSENWDDDFEFQPRGTDQSHSGKRVAMHAPERPVHSNGQEESWDDAFEDGDSDGSPVKRSWKVADEDVEDWDSSDNEARDDPEAGDEQDINLEQQQEYVSGFDEDDKTVTMRSNLQQTSKAPPVPPVPFLSHAPQIPSHFPQPSTSPTISSFSIPISSRRASIYSQDPLMPAPIGSAPHLVLSTMRAYPQSAGSTPRKSRRLRKKSRPPEADIFELEDRDPDPIPVPETPVTPPPPPSPRPVTPPIANTSTLQPTPSPSLLTRIGSLKRWKRRSVGPEDPSATALRRPKASTGPSETGRTSKSSKGPVEVIETDIPPVSPAVPPTTGRLRRSRGESTSGQKAGWFFRVGGDEREETSTALISMIPLAPARTPDSSPSKRSALRLRRRDKDAEVTEGMPTPKKAAEGLFPGFKSGDPVSQIQMQSRPISLPPQPQLVHSMQFPRPRESASVGRSSGSPIFVGPDIDTPTKGRKAVMESRETAGMRSLINGVRRLSLVNGARKRRESTHDPVPAVAEGGRMDISGNLQIRTEDRPDSRAHSLHGEQQPIPHSPTAGTAMDTQALSPFPECDTQPSQCPKNASLPTREIAATDVSVDSTFMRNAHAGGLDSGPSASQYTSPPHTIRKPTRHPSEKHSFTASATSLLAASSTNVTTAAMPQSHVLNTTERSETPPELRAVPTSAQGPPPPSPRISTKSAIPTVPQSASLGRSTASPTHPVSSLRRNSLSDLNVQQPHGELKIPARISRAQQGLRRDLGMVREFAACVEQLKRLQRLYTSLIIDLRAAYDDSPKSPDSRSISPVQVQYHLPFRPSSQSGIQNGIIANDNPSLLSVNQSTSPSVMSPKSFASSHEVGRHLVRLEHDYAIWWECAELLVELGGGSVTGTASNPNLADHGTSISPTSMRDPIEETTGNDVNPRVGPSSLHFASMSEPGSIFEQTVNGTSTGSKGPPRASPPHPSQWRASTGRQDFSARQLRLLKDMLSTPDPENLAYIAGPYGGGTGYPPSHSYPYAVQEGEDSQLWPPWNPSALTLPSEESSTDPDVSGASHRRVPAASAARKERKEKRRNANLLGMLGLREILRGLKRNAVAESKLDGPFQNGQPRSESSASNSPDDDHYNRRRSPWHQHDEHHGGNHIVKSEEVAPLELPPIPSVPPKSPRRPSLASIFRLGQKGPKNGSRSKEAASGTSGDSTNDTTDTNGGVIGDGSDWERLSQKRFDINATAVAPGSATVRGKKPHPRNASYHVNASFSTPKHIPTISQTSLQEPLPFSSTALPHSSEVSLSIAQEDNHLQYQRSIIHGPTYLRKEGRPQVTTPNPPTPRKTAINGTVRSAPPTDQVSTTELKLALTPENIKPLLEYAKEVSTRLGECVCEVRTLLSGTGLATAI